MRRRHTLVVSGVVFGSVAGTLLVLLVAGSAAGPGRASAQDTAASPTVAPGAFTPPVVPQPAECRVPPRSLADLASLSATPMTVEELAPPTPPADLEQAVTADEATTRAVLAVARESIACSNAGDLARGFALVSDGYLRRRVIAVAGPFDEAMYAAIATPSPESADRYITLVSVSQVVVLPDGRAAVEIVASDVRTRRSLVVLVETPAGWRIDELIPLEDSPAPAASPTP